MNLSPIHQTPEEKLALSSQGVLSVAKDQSTKLEEVRQAIDLLTSVAGDKSAEQGGFSAVVSELKGAQRTLADLKDYIDHPEVVVRKLEEVKSVSLITNKLLKDLNKKEVPLMPETKFPEVQKVQLEGIQVITLKGDKGDTPKAGKDYPIPQNGKTPKKGEDYFTVSEIAEFKKAVTPKKGIDYSDGKPGYTPIKDKNYFDGKPGYTPIKGRDYFDGKNGSPDTPDEVVEKVNASKKWINPTRIRGLTSILQTVDQIGKNPQATVQNVGGGLPTIFLSNGVRISDFVTEINFSTNITPVYDGSGRITLTATGGGGTTYQETPSGLINGSNVTYTTTHTITTVLNFAINSQYLHPTSDYTFSGTTITMVNALDASLSGKPYTITYQ